MHGPGPDRERYVLGDASAHVGLLNCERLADRSHIHGWSVEPHYHEGLAQLFVFAGGSVEALVDYQPRRLAGPAVVWVPALVRHGFDYPRGLAGWVVTLPTADVARLAAGRSWLQGWTALPQVLAGPAGATARAADLAARIEAEHAGTGEERTAVLEALVLLLLVELRRGLEAAGSLPAAATGPRRDLANRFQALMDQAGAGTRSVADYAAELAVTPTHLSRSVRSVTGRTAGELIHDRVMLEARRQLAFTDKPISEIAYALHFSTPSYFSRFFLARSQETPGAFRRRMREGAG